MTWVRGKVSRASLYTLKKKKEVVQYFIGGVFSRRLVLSRVLLFLLVTLLWSSDWWERGTVDHSATVLVQAAFHSNSMF